MHSAGILPTLPDSQISSQVGKRNLPGFELAASSNPTLPGLPQDVFAFWRHSCGVTLLPGMLFPNSGGYESYRKNQAWQLIGNLLEFCHVAILTATCLNC